MLLISILISSQRLLLYQQIFLVFISTVSSLCTSKLTITDVVIRQNTIHNEGFAGAQQHNEDDIYDGMDYLSTLDNLKTLNESTRHGLLMDFENACSLEDLHTSPPASIRIVPIINASKESIIECPIADKIAIANNYDKAKAIRAFFIFYGTRKDFPITTDFVKEYQIHAVFIDSSTKNKLLEGLGRAEMVMASNPAIWESSLPEDGEFPAMEARLYEGTSDRDKITKKTMISLSVVCSVVLLACIIVVIVHLYKRKHAKKSAQNETEFNDTNAANDIDMPFGKLDSKALVTAQGLKIINISKRDSNDTPPSQIYPDRVSVLLSSIPRPASSMAVSRSNSMTDPEVIPSYRAAGSITRPSTTINAVGSSNGTQRPLHHGSTSTSIPPPHAMTRSISSIASSSIGYHDSSVSHGPFTPPQKLRSGNLSHEDQEDILKRKPRLSEHESTPSVLNMVRTNRPAVSDASKLAQYHPAYMSPIRKPNHVYHRDVYIGNHHQNKQSTNQHGPTKGPVTGQNMVSTPDHLRDHRPQTAKNDGWTLRSGVWLERLQLCESVKHGGVDPETTAPHDHPQPTTLVYPNPDLIYPVLHGEDRTILHDLQLHRVASPSDSNIDSSSMPAHHLSHVLPSETELDSTQNMRVW